MYDRVADVPASASKLGDYAGTYRSDEVNTMWRVAIRDQKLTIFGDRGAEAVTLTPVFADAFTAPGG